MFTCLKEPLQSSSRKNSAQVSGQDRKKKNPHMGPIKLQDLENSARSQTWKKNKTKYRDIVPLTSRRGFNLP